MSCVGYIWRETMVSIAINTGLSLTFFVGVFGWRSGVPVWGTGHYVADFAPQGFMIGLMATLVPGWLAGAARRSGKVARGQGISRLPRSLMWRSVSMGLAGAAGGIGLSATICAGLGASTIDFLPALIGKLGFGAALAAVVTPAGLRAALAQ